MTDPINFCLKYSGLSIPYGFETEYFLFLPLDYKVNIDNLKRLKDGEILFNLQNCEWDYNSKLYIIAKEPKNRNVFSDNIIDNIPKEYKAIEAILGLLFRKQLKLETITIFKNDNLDHKVLQIYKLVDQREYKENRSIIFSESIDIRVLRKCINSSMIFLKKIKKFEDFIQSYNFCVAIYIESHKTHSLIYKISNSWICLEVLSTIFFSFIEKNSMKLFSKPQFSKLKEIVRKYAKSIPKSQKVCLNEFKNEFPKRTVELISNNISIRRKVKLFLNKVLPDDFKNFELTSCTNELKIISKFIDNFYEFRNQFFHNGKLPDIKGVNNKFSQTFNCFNMMLERILFAMIKLTHFKFFKQGKCHQEIIFDSLPSIYDTFKHPSEEQYYNYYLNFYQKLQDKFSLINEINGKHITIEECFASPLKINLKSVDNNFKAKIDIDVKNDFFQNFRYNYTVNVEDIWLKINQIMKNKTELLFTYDKTDKYVLKFKAIITRLSGSHYAGNPPYSEIGIVLMPNYFEFKFI